MSGAAELSGAVRPPAEHGTPEAVGVFSPPSDYLLALGGQALQVEVVSERLEPAEAAERIATQGYARPAPRFLDQVADTSRTNTFQSTRMSGLSMLTEHEGLVELHDFLQAADSPLAQAMIDNLTFIGEKEYAEGAAGLAAYWKKLLDDDPRLQLCVLAMTSRVEVKTKSDRYLRGRILEHFTDDELRKYKGRLLVDHRSLTESPEHVQIVLVDDWSISGQQVAEASAFLWRQLPHEYAKRVEAHVLALGQRFLDKGLRFVGGTALPFRSYFLAHAAPRTANYGAHISGTHSSVDYDFNDRLCLLVPDPVVVPHVPALREVFRPYRGRIQDEQAERVERLAL